MRALSVRQACRCETAKTKTCKCRCGGAAHGRYTDGKLDCEYFALLPADDPHYIAARDEREAQRWRKRQQRRRAEWELDQSFLRARQGSLFPEGENV